MLLPGPNMRETRQGLRKPRLTWWFNRPSYTLNGCHRNKPLDNTKEGRQIMRMDGIGSKGDTGACSRARITSEVGCLFHIMKSRIPHEARNFDKRTKLGSAG